MAFGSSGTAGLNRLSIFTPFMLDKNSRKRPTRFELRAAVNGNIFLYKLAVDRHRILEESLKYVPPYPKRMQFRSVFERRWNSKAKAQTWKNGKVLGNAYREIQESLERHEPFMSFVVSRLKIESVEPFAQWIFDRWPDQIFAGHAHLPYSPLVPFVLRAMPKIRQQVVDVVKSFDTGIDDIQIASSQDGEGIESEQSKIWAVHKTSAGTVRWPFGEESTGTQRLCDLASRMLQAFKDGTLMVADELSSSIHPTITRRIIEMFQSKKTNPNRAQLIFTSHDNTLQRQNLLRRDQIWFTEKRADGSTELYPLTDFRPRNDLAIDRAYLDGRFGAVPILQQELHSSNPKRN
jgi:hypothetical protein